MKMKHLSICTLAACLLSAASLQAENDSRRPMLLANYYTWYSTGTGPNKTWTHWITHAKANKILEEARATGKVPATFAQNEIASTLYPLVGLYDSNDPEIVRWHIRLAKAAGIDAFLVDWWGPGNWQRVPGLTQQVFEKLILPIAKEENFKVALLDEPVQFRPLKESKQWVAQYLAKYKDEPAYLHIDGKPAYYVYQVAFDPGTDPAEFAELKAYVEERVGPVYWIFEAINNQNGNFQIPKKWLDTQGIDAISFYGTFSIFPAHLYEELAARYSKVAKQAHQAGKKMCLPVHPGHDNRQEGNPVHYVMPRRDGETLKDYLRAATDAKADYIMITSFNEWPETTVIEPSSSWKDPYQYLRIVAEWRGVNFVPPPVPARISK